MTPATWVPIGLLLGSLLAPPTLSVLPGVTPTAARAQTAAPELAPSLGWLNTDKPLRLSAELKGHVVVLDFWTFSRVNGAHVLPDLDDLERKYKDEPFLVIGVHSAKFTGESDRQSVRDAVTRSHIQRPVVIDQALGIWKKYAAQSWPQFFVIDTQGNIAGETSGEGAREILDATIRKLLDEGRKAGTLAPRKAVLKPDRTVASTGGLSYPGKVTASSRNLFISDSSQNRVVVATYPDKRGMCTLTRVLGDAPAGAAPSLTDGDEQTARFHNPQGLALDEASSTLYVADTGNHAVRAIDLATGTVRTLAGDGRPGRDSRGGKSGSTQPLNSPWDLALSPDRKTLYVAMAGLHQIWRIDPATGVARALAGTGKEDLTDGPAPVAALAQPTGLTLSSNGRMLYFADSQTSSIRALDLASRTVSTILGTGPSDFGDIDGSYPEARLQHPQGVTIYPTPKGDRLFVADTFNHRVRIADPIARRITSWLGVGRAPAPPTELRLDGPGGVFYSHPADAHEELFVADTNNHRVVMIDPQTNRWREVVISGLRPPGDSGQIPATAVAAPVPALPGRSMVLSLTAILPTGARANAEAPLSLRVSSIEGNSVGPVLAQYTIRPDKFPVQAEVPGMAVKADAQLLAELSFAYCKKGQEAFIIPAQVAWRITLTKGTASAADLKAPAR